MAAIYLNEVLAGYLTEPLTLEIPDRTFAIVTGLRSAGTSSVLRAVAGLEKISGGEIRLGEKRIDNLAPPDRDVGMVFGNDTLYPQMTVRGNIAFGLKRRRFGANEIKKRVEEIAASLSLADWMERKPQELSLAERQRVAIARAVVRQPKVLLFDHALDPLDERSRAELGRQITALHERLQATTIFATTDSSEAMSLADFIAVLHDGVLQAFGAPGALYRQPDNIRIARSLGRPPMNFFHGTLKRDRGSLRFQEANSGTIQFDVPNPDRFDLGVDEIVLGIRPEDIEMTRTSSAKPAHASANFRAIIESVLHFGGSTDIYFQTGAQLGICRSSEWLEKTQAGQRIEFVVNLEKVCFFNGGTGKRIV